MDKQMIEEMAKDMGIAFQISGTTKFATIAEMLVSYGYRKIPDGVVVLTESKEELLHEMYEQGKFDAMADLEKDGKVVLTREEYDGLKLIASNYGKAIKETEIKTAEKFAERLKEEVLNYCGTPEEMWLFEAGKIDFCQDIDEICKEIIGGKDDDTSKVSK
jgi:hypothetical protein